jgi:hypothetical protein
MAGKVSVYQGHHNTTIRTKYILRIVVGLSTRLSAAHAPDSFDTLSGAPRDPYARALLRH